MSDPLSPSQRHTCMSHIRSANTKPEVKLRKELFGLGYRYRINQKGLPGSPDIVLAKYRTCIFVNGCFWHGHKDCRYATKPKTNVKFWCTKIENNRERDLRDYTFLESLGWRAIVVWECELKKDRIDSTIATVREQLDANRELWMKEMEDRKASRMQRLEENRQRKEHQAQLLDEMENYFGSSIKKDLRISKDSEGLNSIEIVDEPALPSPDRKAQEERDAVLPVLRLMRINVASVVSQESPDILVRCVDGKNIGIEVTKCYPSIIDDSGNASKVANLKSHIIDNYQRSLLARGENHSIVCVRFKGRIYGQHSGPDTLIIKNAVEEIDRYRKNERILSDPERFIKGTEAFNKLGKLLQSDNLRYKYVDKVTVTESEDFLTNVYEDFDVRFSRDIQPHHLQNRIDDKDKKLSQYKMMDNNQDIDEYWLVIQIPSIEAFDLSETEMYSDLKTSYDKVFVNGFSKIIQIL